MPRYPEIRVSSESSNPLTVVSAVRYALRRAGVERPEIEAFSRQALSTSDPHGVLRVCREWVGRAEAPEG